MTTLFPTICIDSDVDDAALASQLQAHQLSVDTANRLSEIFKALSDPTRLRIIALLLQHEVCVHTLEKTLGMTQSAVSHQLRLLRQLHLVRYRKQGRHVYYALDDDHVRGLFQQGLLHIQHDLEGTHHE
jgi:DNA-binding transcriptional ArsR family regulator